MNAGLLGPGRLKIISGVVSGAAEGSRHLNPRKDAPIHYRVRESKRVRVSKKREVKTVRMNLKKLFELAVPATEMYEALQNLEAELRKRIEQNLECCHVIRVFKEILGE